MTCSEEQCCGVGETQKDVVDEALEHGDVQVTGGGQVLGRHCGATDQR